MTTETPKTEQSEAAGRAASGVERLVMCGPKRIQRKRTKGWRLPPNTVCVDRTSRYGNPCRVGYCPNCGVTHTRAEAVAEFRALCDDPEVIDRIREHLRGKNLACWCRLDQECHADVLLEIANT